MACDRCNKHSCNGTCSAVNRRGPTGPKGPPGMDGRIQGDGTAGIVPYIVSVNSKNQITALANTNVTYQQLNVLAAGAGGGTRVLTTDNLGDISWQVSSGGGGIVSVVPGAGIAVDNTDPLNPIVSSTITQGIGGSGTLNFLAKFTPNGTTIGNSTFFDNGTGIISAGYESATARMSFKAGVLDGSVIGYHSGSAIGANAANVASYIHTIKTDTSIRLAGLYGVDASNSTLTYVKVGLFDGADFSTNTIKSGFRFNLTDIVVLSDNISAGNAVFVDIGGGVLALRQGAAAGGITSLNGLTGATQTFTDDTNVTIVSGGTAHVVTWAGTLADGRIASAATWNSKESALTFSTGLTRVVDTITIDSTVVTLTGAQALTNKTYNGNTWTAGSNTLTLAGNFITTGAFNTTFAQQATATITLPSATSTLLANNLGITGGSTWISGTAVGDKAIIQATSNATHTAAKDLITLRKNSSAAAATSVLMTIGDGQGLNNDEVSIYTGVNTGTSGYLLRAGATFAYFNASSSLRLQIAAADIIQLSSSTATFVQGLTISDAKNIVLNTTTGTKIGTATSQKLGFWNKTPIVQPTTSITGATRVGGGGATITDTDTFGGYTLAQFAAIVINTGLAA